MPKDANGVSTAPLHKIGDQVAAFCEMYFDDVALTEDVRIDSALLKYYAVKACVEVASNAMQIYGGLGYTAETRLGRIWIDLRGMQIAGAPTRSWCTSQGASSPSAMPVLKKSPIVVPV